MEFFFGDELLDMIALHFLNVFLQLDFEPLDLFLHLLPSYGADVGVEVDFWKVSLEDILHQQNLVDLSPTLHHTLIF